MGQRVTLGLLAPCVPLRICPHCRECPVTEVLLVIELQTHIAPLDPASHLQFLTDLLERVDTSKSPEAHVLLLATLAHAKLLFGDHEGTKNDIDAAWKVLDELSGVDPSVNAAYYEVAADYYKVRRRPHRAWR